MGRFTEDMGRLRDEIESDRLARLAQVAETRQVISDLKDSVEALQADFRQAHADMAQAGRVDRSVFLTQLGNTVADIRVATATQQASVREALAEAAAATRAELAQVTSARRNEVAELRDEFVRAHGAMAVEVRTAGQAFVADVVGAVADIKREADALVDAFADERRAGAQAWRAGAAKPVPTPHKAKAAPEPVKPSPKAKPKVAVSPEPPVKAAEKPVEKVVVENVRPATDDAPGA